MATTLYSSFLGAVVRLKKAAAYGQDDLFAGRGGDDEADAAGFGIEVKIGEEEWPRRQLLATEGEMLGMYVSAHPLDGTENLLAANHDTIVDLVASGRRGLGAGPRQRPGRHTSYLRPGAPDTRRVLRGAYGRGSGTARPGVSPHQRAVRQGTRAHHRRSPGRQSPKILMLEQ
jgi:hypothetical protein